MKFLRKKSFVEILATIIILVIIFLTVVGGLR